MNKTYILPFDHRGSLIRRYIGDRNKLTKKQIALIEDLKHLIYEGFLSVWEKIPNPENLAILVDDQYGSKVIKDAVKKNIEVFLTIEKTGQKEFKFQYGENFKKVFKKYKVFSAKALIRYNPANKKINASQLKRLKVLQDYCKKENIKFLLEPLILPEISDMKKAGGSREAYDKKIRANLFIKAVKEIRKAGIDPDVWKIEAFYTKQEWKKAIKTIRDTKKHAGIQIVLLGRGESKKTVIQWFKTARSLPINGFAVGRTIFLKELDEYVAKKITRKQAVDRIAENYLFFIRLWDRR